MHRKGRISIVVFAVALVVPIVAGATNAWAQYFPPSGPSIAELEAEAERVAIEQRTREAAEAKALEREVAHRERIEELFPSILQKTLDGLARARRTDDTFKALQRRYTERRNSLALAMIAFHQGEFSAAERALRGVTREPVWDGRVHDRQMRIEFSRLYDSETGFESYFNEEDGEWRERDRKSVRREQVDSKRGIEAAISAPNQQRPDLRKTRLEGTVRFIDSYSDVMQRANTMWRSIQADSFDADAIWNLAELLADQSLGLTVPALQWLYVLRQAFPDHARIVEGRVDARVAAHLRRMGLYDTLNEYFQERNGEASAWLEKRVADRKALRDQMQEEGLEASDLTPEERDLLTGRRRDQTRYFRGSTSRIEAEQAATDEKERLFR